ncbi:MAG: SRPBCC family protein [Thermoleophilaceae bacterium]|nr:SRPBCC family protein [Thermoleophilaceae bacterium]
MPSIRRERALAAPREAVWTVVRDPGRLPEWWPSVTRVEDVSAEAWTTVMETPRGKSLRADYTVVESVTPERLVWRHEIEESPFERIMSDSRYQLLLEPAGDRTTVKLAHRIRLRGFARFGSIQVRLATKKTLDGALEGLERLVELH